MATVKGIFVLNDFLQLPPFDTYYVNFKSSDKSYTYFSIIFNSRTLYYKNQDGGTYTYSFGSDTWTNNVYKTIDFGTTPQEVSDDFYTWLTANATQQGGEEETTGRVTITHNGNVIATFSDGQTATLPCEGKKMVGDIVIAYGVDTVNLISFTIDGTSYQAEEGMTWEQWANSSYNTAGAYATGLNYSINGKWIADARNGGAVLHQDAIKANREYFLKDHTGGGGND